MPNDEDICFNSIPEAIEEQDEKFQIEATSNPDLNNNESETNNESITEDAYVELNENVINEDEGNLENGNIDEGGSQHSDGPGDNEMSVSGERGEEMEDGMHEEELNEDTEKQFQQSLDHLGIISVHHDGYIRFWNYEVL
jgi:hypothetical protein